MAWKSEARNSKSATRAKSEAPMIKTLEAKRSSVLNFVVRSLGFVWNFGFRISNFGLVAVLIVILSSPSAVYAQNAPRVGYVYPAGGRQGETFRVRVGGQYLASVINTYVSGAGVQVTILEYDRPLPQRQINALNEKIQGLQKQITTLNAQVPELQKQGKAADVLKEIAALRAQITGIRAQIAASRKRMMNPVLSEFLTLEVTIAPDAPLGTRQLRVASVAGLSNPLVFCVGQLPEFTEGEPNDGATDTQMNITLPATVNGQMLPNATDRPQQGRPGQQFTPGDIDQYQFHARKGQPLVVTVSARQLVPYLADAVPGWFQAVVTLYDVRGKELAYDDDYRFHPDPVLHYRIPDDGDYLVEIKDALYRGREDFVYRLSIGELPYVTGIFPLGGRAGTQTDVNLVGWNLPTNKLTVDANSPSAIHHPQFINSVPFAVDTLPEMVETQDFASLPQEMQDVNLPIIINGRIDRSDDVDVFRFAGHAGDAVVVETVARRLDSPLDSLLRLVDPNGRQLAFNDDHEDKGSGLDTHHADSFIMATLPTDGTYFVQVSDAQHQGGAEYAYRLRISAPRPDFDLRVAPSGLGIRAGQTVPFSVYALRKDGFAGEIKLALKDAPAGFTLKGGTIQANQDKTQVTMTAPPNPLPEPLNLSVEGRATIGGRQVVHAATPADDMMQAFAYRHLVPARELKVLVMDRRGGQPPRLLTALPLKVPTGGTARVRVDVLSLRFFENVRFELTDPLDGIVLQDVAMNPQNAELAFQFDAEKVKSGTKGNLVVSVSGERTPLNADQPKPAARRRISLGSLQAMPFEIVEPNLP